MKKTIYPIVSGYENTLGEGFNIRLEARLKNGYLARAREQAGLTAREVAKEIGISYPFYLSIESMRAYPSKETQKKICDFYRRLGIFLFEEDVFPEELRVVRPKSKYIAEKTIPKTKLVPLAYISEKMLPVAEDVAKSMEADEILTKIKLILNDLSVREREVIKMRFGLDGEKPKTFREIGELLGVSTERSRQIEARALYKIRNNILKEYLKGIRK